MRTGFIDTCLGEREKALLVLVSTKGITGDHERGN